MMEEITIKSQIKDFKVVFTDNFQFIDGLAENQNSAVVVGRTVYRLYKKKLFSKFPKNRLIVISLTEKTKTLGTVQMLYQRLLKFPCKKNLTLISFGGGINQDVVGFTASTLYRGIHWIYVPTTLLAQADSCIGLKTSLNFSLYKNLIGTFYPPEKIYINPGFNDTLADQYYLSGVGEMIKLLLMDDKSMQKLEKIAQAVKNVKEKNDKILLLQTIRKCLEIKLRYMHGDEFDTGRRNLLNYGHEFGHALEPASNFRISHGIGVILGMIFANIASLRRGNIEEHVFDFILNKIFLPVLSVRVIHLQESYFPKEVILSKIRQDKKRLGKDLVLVTPGKNLEFEKVIDYSEGEFDADYSRFMEIIEPFFRK